MERWSISSLTCQLASFVMRVLGGGVSVLVGRLYFQAYMVAGRDRRVFRPVAFTAWQTFDFGIIVRMHEIAD